MPAFNPGESKAAKVVMSNPTAKAFDYEGVLCMGVNMAAMAEASFHLEPSKSKDISFPVTMPTAPGTYPVYLDVSSGGVLLVHYQAAENIEILTAVKGTIALYGEGFPVVGDPLLWWWNVKWYYPDTDMWLWSRRFPYNYWVPYSPPEPINLDHLYFKVQEGADWYGITAWGPFGPFVVKDGGVYTINISTGQLREGVSEYYG